MVLPVAAQRQDRVVVLDGADLDLQVEVAPDLRADRPHDIEQEARAVFQRAAVVVVAVVDRRAEELGEEIAVGPVNLDAVEPGRLGPGGGRRRTPRRPPGSRAIVICSRS